MLSWVEKQKSKNLFKIRDREIHFQKNSSFQILSLSFFLNFTNEVKSLKVAKVLLNTKNII